MLTYEQHFEEINAMRARFAAVITDMVLTDSRIVCLFADITWDKLSKEAQNHSRFINFGIREQLLIDAASGLATTGLRPIAHTFASFLIERPFEQIKIGLNHQSNGCVLVSAGASYDLAVDGRTHESPADIALLSTLEGWQIGVPGNANEAEYMLRSAGQGNGLNYIRLSTYTNSEQYWFGQDGFVTLRQGNQGTLLVVGPLASTALEAVKDLDLTVLYAAEVRPFDYSALRSSINSQKIIVVEPYLVGTSAAEIEFALEGVAHQSLYIGVPAKELKKYGTPDQHSRAFGLDCAGMKFRIEKFILEG